MLLCNKSPYHRPHRTSSHEKALAHHPVLRLKRLGLSKMFRRLVVTLIRRYGVSLIHLDASAECLPGLPTFNW
ncbi:hypothetical protein BM772_000003 [Escherichia coli]|nr:hypothetical protein [Escherichia coli]EFG3002944.1 hypothetical protein [Escherichia coli]EFG4401950.1 hypothetical protein [Escherichia coli]